MVLILPPLSVILSWPKPNYVDPVRRGPAIYVITGIMLGLATLVLVARMYARLVIRRWFGLDDAFIILSYLCAVGVTAVVFVGCIHYSWDRHVWDVPVDQVLPGGRALFTGVILWALSTSFTKFSLLCFYYRLVEHIQFKKYRWVLHAILLFQIAFTTAYLLTLIFMCVPVDAFWVYPPNLNATCIHTGNFLFTISIINTVLEAVVWFAPLPILLQLNLNPSQRLPVTCLLMTGALVPIVGAVRCYYVWIDIVVSWDAYWNSEPQWICSDLENYLALICACAPALRPLFGRWFGSKDAMESRDRAQLIAPRSEMTETPDSAMKMQHVHPHDLIWFDLEGIAEDGLGYSVSITTGKDGLVEGVVKNKKTGFNGLKAKSSLGRLMGHKPKTDYDKDTEAQTEEVEARSRSRLTTRGDTDQKVENKLPKSILTKRTVEIRESFGSEHNNFDNQAWQSLGMKDMVSSSSSAYSEEHLSERLDRLGVLPPLDVALQQDGRQRPQTAPIPAPSNDANPWIPQMPEMAVQASQLPRWLTPPQAPLSRRRYRGDNVLAPRNSSQWWAASFGGNADANENPTARSSVQGPTRPQTAAGSSHPVTRKAVESIAAESWQSDDGSFMREFADLREMIQSARGAATAPADDDESVLVEDGSIASDQGERRPGTADRMAMAQSQRRVKEWTEKGSKT